MIRAWILVCVVLLGCGKDSDPKEQLPTVDCPEAECPEVKECPTPSVKGTAGDGFWCQPALGNEGASWKVYCRRSKKGCSPPNKEQSGELKGYMMGECFNEPVAWCPVSAEVPCGLGRNSCDDENCELTY